MDKNKQLFINMLASLTSCIVGLGISFFLTPYIQGSIGYEAVGFVKLANDFVNYAAIAAMALNSMASRFITIKIHQNDMKTANEYFNSVLFGNFVITAVLFVPSVLIVMYLEQLIHIPTQMVLDVKLLFAAVFLNFMVTIVGTTLSVATFAANRLDLSSKRTIESNLLRCVLIISAFALLPVKICYVGITTLICTLYLLGTHFYYTRTLFPAISFGFRYFKFARVFEVILSGVWNTLMRTGQVLNNGLDLLITNLWISDYMMGLLGTAQTIAAAINTLYDTISGVFSPALTIYYAKGQKDKLMEELLSSMKLTGFFANIPLCFIIAFGIPFYKLWLFSSTPTECRLIYELTILIMGGTIIGGAASPLFNIFTVVNKLKYNSIVVFIQGLLQLSILFVLLNTTSIGIYGVAGISTIVAALKNLTFTPLYAAHCLQVKKTAFYPTLIRYTFVSLLMAGIFSLFYLVLPINSWFSFCGALFLCGIVGSLLNFLLLFGKRERAMVFAWLSIKRKY